jgi:hypothetical protein
MDVVSGKPIFHSIGLAECDSQGISILHDHRAVWIALSNADAHGANTATHVQRSSDCVQRHLLGNGLQQELGAGIDVVRAE